MKRFPVFIAAVLILAACEGRNPVANGANDVAGLPDIATNAPDPESGPPENASAAADAAPIPAGADPPAPGARIPAALQGRWGMVPGDCTSTRGDAKGLLTISADQLRFYESRAVPGSDVEGDGNSVRGTFNFTGEGQEWTRFVTLRAEGNRLTRTESNPTASYNYVKCA
ncbi:hypothetical protein H9L13_10650 [Sphingomonas lutea]|uniref:Uncharacterized protein n=1 Tax=Sphingomonas lutea TaxID=1045317 RepID=A0A7G9SGV4_9SPHN|nr:hypothetical protein [Sphingomonas lutea]QNN67079.1 hypothetical protein H9L13_10650 [Sphingomonas lutea]